MLTQISKRTDKTLVILYHKDSVKSRTALDKIKLRNWMSDLWSLVTTKSVPPTPICL